MRVRVFPGEAAAALGAAEAMRDAVQESIAARGRFVAALSGGATPWKMLRILAEMDIPWDKVWIAQVDERVAPEGHADRNLRHLRESLAAAPLPPEQILAMPVEMQDLPTAAVRYAAVLSKLCGSPAVLDLVHLGLGADGHTASLVPVDPVLEMTDADVAITGPYQGRRRMTLTFPLINRARQILWLATGPSKAPMIRRLCEGDTTIPAGRVRQDAALLLTDEAAARTSE